MGQRLEQSLLRHRKYRQIQPIVILTETLPAARSRIEKPAPSVQPVNPQSGGLAHIREVVDSSANKQRKQRGVHPDAGLISASSVFPKRSSMIRTAETPAPAASCGEG